MFQHRWHVLCSSIDGMYVCVNVCLYVRMTIAFCFYSHVAGTLALYSCLEFCGPIRLEENLINNY